jgi:hypothetical protein
MALPSIGPNTQVRFVKNSPMNPFDEDYFLVNGEVVSMADYLDATPAYKKKLTDAAKRAEEAVGTNQAEVSARVEQTGLPRAEAQEQLSDEDWLTSFISFGEGNLEDQLKLAGADMGADEVQRFLREAPGMDIDPAMLGAFIPTLARTYPGAGATAYQQAIEAGGFGEEYQPPPLQLGAGDHLSGRGHAQVEPIPGSAPNYEQSGDLIRFKNGVVVDSASGQVLFEPGSVTPGSPAWMIKVPTGWSDEKVAEWRERLYNLGYDVEKKGGADQGFLAALQAYHISRYQNGGQVIPLQAGGAGAREEKAKLVDVRDEMGATIRNTVRETYRRIYGTDPTDGEIEAFSGTIFDTAMQLQRQFRSKYGDPNVSAAVQESTERQVEKLEGSPSAVMLRESDEENTRLRDAMETAIVATRGLAG